MDLRQDCDFIVKKAVSAVRPEAAVQRALQGETFDSGRLVLVAIGKAAWSMASAAYDVLGSKIDSGIVITKYGHVKGPLGPLVLREAGHPVPDANTFAATEEALKLTEGLTGNDTVLFLISGGGSALFESPLIASVELMALNRQLLNSGASIVEINTIRKRLSAVKGGRFAEHCAPAKVYSIILSDIIGDPPDMIASGPAYPDSSTCEEALALAAKYGLSLSDKAKALLERETPKALGNIRTLVTGSVRGLCRAAADAARTLGYEPLILTDSLNCEAREAGSFLAAIARSHQNPPEALAFIAGGETVVHVTGTGRGGRNQELALSAAAGIRGLTHTAVFSFGSDGTDGPTDAAGGFVTGESAGLLAAAGADISLYLDNNDAYSALAKCGGLIMTGPTGTNVNDAAVLLIRP